MVVVEILEFVFVNWIKYFFPTIWFFAVLSILLVLFLFDIFFLCGWVVLFWSMLRFCCLFWVFVGFLQYSIVLSNLLFRFFRYFCVLSSNWSNLVIYCFESSYCCFWSVSIINVGYYFHWFVLVLLILFFFCFSSFSVFFVVFHLVFFSFLILLILVVSLFDNFFGHFFDVFF